MQYHLGGERGFIIRDSGVIGVPLRWGAAHINDDAALAARLHWRRRHTGEARRPSLSQQLAPATRHRRTGCATPPTIASAAAQPLTRRACRAERAAHPGLRPQTFVSHCNPMPHKY